MPQKMETAAPAGQPSRDYISQQQATTPRKNSAGQPAAQGDVVADRRRLDNHDANADVLDLKKAAQADLCAATTYIKIIVTLAQGARVAQ